MVKNKHVYSIYMHRWTGVIQLMEISLLLLTTKFEPTEVQMLLFPVELDLQNILQ